MIIPIITYILAIVAATSAAAILFVKEVFDAALCLIVCLLCIAGIFVTFNAEFLAVVQIIVYAGGVVLLLVFGIMLTVRDKAGVASNNMIISCTIGLALFAMLIYILGNTAPQSIAPQMTPEVIGRNLITRFAIEFELAGVLLLISLVGAIAAATNLKKSRL